MIKIIFILFFFNIPAYADRDPSWDKPLTPIGSEFTAEDKPVIVDRHILSKQDYLHDPEVLLSISTPAPNKIVVKGRPKPKTEGQVTVKTWWSED